MRTRIPGITQRFYSPTKFTPEQIGKDYEVFRNAFVLNYRVAECNEFMN